MFKNIERKAIHKMDRIIDRDFFEPEITRMAREQAQFCVETIENYLKLLIENGNKIEDVTQGYDKDGLVRIFVKNQLVCTFRFISELVEGENSTFKWVTNVYREDY
jgi:hypothetical protein